MSARTILITGAAKGIGRALAEFFMARGDTVLVHYHTSEVEAQQLTAPLYRADLTNQAEVEAMARAILQDHSVDVLINTVGPFIYKPFAEVSVEEFDHILMGNLHTAFATSKAFLPHMLAQGHGDIINFACAGAERMILTENTAPYYLAKTGVVSLTKTMAKTYAPQGIRVNCVSPGIMENTVAEVASIPAGRKGNFADICHAVAYLLSLEAAYCNGTNLDVAGGWNP